MSLPAISLLEFGRFIGTVLGVAILIVVVGVPYFYLVHRRWAFVESGSRGVEGGCWCGRGGGRREREGRGAKGRRRVCKMRGVSLSSQGGLLDIIVA